MVKKEISKINKVLFNISGKGDTTTKVSVPFQWLQEMGVTAEDRNIKLTKKKNKIILEKAPEQKEGEK